ncbi:GTP-binding protein [Streptomyces sp. C]|uniref:GTP-binding protein n=1 Tax=Streptomyces sp. C TaxID=253839 RepID=UPI0001B57DA6|nr:GTP-binding protein [Streptomyces sp. C]
MAASGSEAGKPEVTIASLGGAGYGKTTTVRALARYLALQAGTETEEAEVIAGGNVRRFVYETARRRYIHLDCPGEGVGDLLKSWPLDGALLVVDVRDDIDGHVAEHLAAASAAGVPRFVVLLNLWNDLGNESLDLRRRAHENVHYLMRINGYGEDRFTVTYGSALEALEIEAECNYTAEDLVRELEQ